MFLKSWLSTLVNRFRFNCNRRRHGLPPFLRQTKQQVHLFSRHNVGSFSGQSEQLEDRTLLAANITIVNGGGAADDCRLLGAHGCALRRWLQPRDGLPGGREGPHH